MSIFQRLLNYLYRLPKSRLRRYLRFGGYLRYQRMLRGERQMKKAAWALPIIDSYEDGAPIFFLTGERYIHLTLFCIRSLVRTTKTRFRFVLVDDGTFNSRMIEMIRSRLPGVTIVEQKSINERLNVVLPIERYPHLRARREVYPHLRKLTDIHVLDEVDWKLVLDSDMLFWREPEEILDWLYLPSRPVHMIEQVESYGYDRELMSSLAGAIVPKKLNVGIFGFQSTKLDWDILEKWVMELESTSGTSYFLEQALSTMLVAGNEPMSLDPGRYEVLPKTIEERDDLVLQHYVDLSRYLYMTEAWQKIC